MIVNRVFSNTKNHFVFLIFLFCQKTFSNNSCRKLYLDIFLNQDYIEIHCNHQPLLLDPASTGYLIKWIKLAVFWGGKWSQTLDHFRLLRLSTVAMIAPSALKTTWDHECKIASTGGASWKPKGNWTELISQISNLERHRVTGGLFAWRIKKFGSWSVQVWSCAALVSTLHYVIIIIRRQFRFLWWKDKIPGLLNISDISTWQNCCHRQVCADPTLDPVWPYCCKTDCNRPRGIFIFF